MYAVRIWCWALFIAPLCGACGGKSAQSNRGTQELLDGSVPATDAGTPESPNSKADFAERATEIYCNNLQHCCGDAGAFVMSGCRSQSLKNWSAIVADPLTEYDSSTAAHCLAAIDMSTRNCGLGILGIDLQTAPCNRTFVGTGQRGAPCTDKRQCAPIENGSVTCETDFDASASSNGPVCLHYLPPPHGTLGQACDCTISEGTSCTRLWNATGPSDDLAACFPEDGLYCDIRSGVCKATGELGQPCQLDYPSCKSGLFCGDDDICHPAPREGDSCEQRMAVCEANLRCYYGHCAPLPALGEPCDFLLDRHCAGGSHCSLISNTCALPEPLGAGCWSNSDCISGNCDLGGGFDVGFGGHCIANPLNDAICADISNG